MTCWDYVQIDNLTYSYTAGTNKISGIADAAAAVWKEKGFKPGTGSYVYDVNGNLNGNGVVNETNVVATNEVLQENHYYPFGLNTEGPWMNDAAPDNKYQYNGKEINDDFGLNLNDYGARWYDASVGRFMAIDPVSGMYSSLSPYVYTMNNPLKYIDPTGMMSEAYNFAFTDWDAMRADHEARAKAIQIDQMIENAEKNGQSDSQESGNTQTVPFQQVTESNKANISKISWGETSGIYPTVNVNNPSEKEKSNPELWDSEKTLLLGEARAAIDYIGENRNSDVHSDSPDLGDKTEKTLAAYHLKDNIGYIAPEILSDPSAKYFYLSNNKNAKTPAISSYFTQEIVKTYGPFYNNGGGDVPKGPVYIMFYAARPKP